MMEVHGILEEVSGVKLWVYWKLLGLFSNGLVQRVLTQMAQAILFFDVLFSAGFLLRPTEFVILCRKFQSDVSLQFFIGLIPFYKDAFFAAVDTEVLLLRAVVAHAVNVRPVVTTREYAVHLLKVGGNNTLSVVLILN